MVVATALFGFSCLNATYRLLNWTGNFVYNCSCARKGAAWLATVGSSSSTGVRARAHQRSLWVVLGPSSTLRTRHPVTGQDGQTHHHGSSRPLQYHRWFCSISKREINKYGTYFHLGGCF